MNIDKCSFMITALFYEVKNNYGSQIQIVDLNAFCLVFQLPTKLGVDWKKRKNITKQLRSKMFRRLQKNIYLYINF